MAYVKVAYIQNTQGLQGELKAQPLTDQVDRFAADIPYFLGRKKDPVRLAAYRTYKGLVYLKFVEITDIDQAAPYKNDYLYIREEDRLPLEAGHYYKDQLLGLTIVDQERGPVGQLVDLVDTAVHEVIQGRDAQGRDFYLPARAPFVQGVDLDQGRIFVTLIEGILHED